MKILSVREKTAQYFVIKRVYTLIVKDNKCVLFR